MRVILIDDHALFRVGLQGLLERRGIDVVAAVGDPEEGIRLAAAEKPDLLLIDLRMPKMDGLSILRHLAREQMALSAVVLTMSPDETDLATALQLGARGYLLKDMEPDELVASLHNILTGNVAVAPGLTSVLAELVKQGHPSSQDDHQWFDSLTPRELEILKHLSEGQSNKVIAQRLEITDGTVKLHVKAVLRKLGVRSRVEAAVMAVENGFRRHDGGTKKTAD
ncbi:MAG: two-component system response regulator NarL [Acidiferrobacteraceae bacterium]|nr:two-component system response regulator NarL [Acidiferrobacteraceae bacterium]